MEKNMLKKHGITKENVQKPDAQNRAWSQRMHTIHVKNGFTIVKKSWIKMSKKDVYLQIFM